MSASLSFTVYMKPEPQGSSKAFVIPGTNRASITSDNVKMKPFRSEVTRMAIFEAGRHRDGDDAMFGKGVPVRVQLGFVFRPPASAKKRRHPVVKPDVDKLVRAMLDALTGVAFHDDAQVIQVLATKSYGPVEMATVLVEAT